MCWGCVATLTQTLINRQQNAKHLKSSQIISALISLILIYSNTTSGLDEYLRCAVLSVLSVLTLILVVELGLIPGSTLILGPLFSPIFAMSYGLFSRKRQTCSQWYSVRIAYNSNHCLIHWLKGNPCPHRIILDQSITTLLFV